MSRVCSLFYCAGSAVNRTASKMLNVVTKPHLQVYVSVYRFTSSSPLHRSLHSSSLTHTTVPMTTLRQFQMNDLFRFNNVNLDVLTETYNQNFYLSYMSQWPEAFTVAEGPSPSFYSNSDSNSYSNANSSDSDSPQPSRSSSSTQPQSQSSPTSLPPIMGYMLGKSEGMGKLWHGHVSAVTVAPTYRRLGLAKVLMDDLETISTNVYNAYFVDLFVRASNTLAIRMYEQFGYVKYRRVLGYYSSEDRLLGMEDAFDMRKALRRDVRHESVIPLTHPVRPEDLEW